MLVKTEVLGEDGSLGDELCGLAEAAVKPELAVGEAGV